MQSSLFLLSQDKEIESYVLSKCLIDTILMPSDTSGDSGIDTESLAITSTVTSSNTTSISIDFAEASPHHTVENSPTTSPSSVASREQSLFTRPVSFLSSSVKGTGEHQRKGSGGPRGSSSTVTADSGSGSRHSMDQSAVGKRSVAKPSARKFPANSRKELLIGNRETSLGKWLRSDGILASPLSRISENSDCSFDGPSGDDMSVTGSQSIHGHTSQKLSESKTDSEITDNAKSAKLMLCPNDILIIRNHNSRDKSRNMKNGITVNSSDTESQLHNNQKQKSNSLNSTDEHVFRSEVNTNNDKEDEVSDYRNHQTSLSKNHRLEAGDAYHHDHDEDDGDDGKDDDKNERRHKPNFKKEPGIVEEMLTTHVSSISSLSSKFEIVTTNTLAKNFTGIKGEMINDDIKDGHSEIDFQNTDQFNNSPTYNSVPKHRFRSPSGRLYSPNSDTEMILEKNIQGEKPSRARRTSGSNFPFSNSKSDEMNVDDEGSDLEMRKRKSNREKNRSAKFNRPGYNSRSKSDISKSEEFLIFKHSDEELDFTKTSNRDTSVSSEIRQDLSKHRPSQSSIIKSSRPSRETDTNGLDSTVTNGSRSHKRRHSKTLSQGDDSNAKDFKDKMPDRIFSSNDKAYSKDRKDRQAALFQGNDTYDIEVEVSHTDKYQHRRQHSQKRYSSANKRGNKIHPS